MAFARTQKLRGCARGYTLIEILIVVVLLGIAGAMVIPSMSGSSPLRTQAAVRTVVADIAFMQADAMAFQSRYVMVFNTVIEWDDDASVWVSRAGNGYSIYAPPPGTTVLDVNNNAHMLMTIQGADLEPYTRDFDQGDYGGATIQNANFNGNEVLVLDELGGPVVSLVSDAPGVIGTVEIAGMESLFRVSVETFTGRVTVTRVN